MYKNIIWDFDGTLYNTYPGLARTYQKVLREKYNVEYNYEKILIWAKKSLGLCAEKLADEVDINVKELKRKFHREYLKGAPVEEPPFPGAREICQYVLDNKGKNYIITHRGRKTLVRLLEKYNMSRYFAELITGDDEFPRKPDPSSFNYLIKKYDLNRNKTLAVGDRKLDILAAKRAGLTTCFFSAEGLKNEDANYQLDDLRKLKIILDQN